MMGESLVNLQVWLCLWLGRLVLVLFFFFSEGSRTRDWVSVHMGVYGPANRVRGLSLSLSQTFQISSFENVRYHHLRMYDIIIENVRHHH
jgi:hypothetical protein